jgi:3-hydroxyacyl-CoA dehydrogenase/enoyl-CoA hydratase/3-hydroxybutyryl-CoA epimerase
VHAKGHATPNADAAKYRGATVGLHLDRAIMQRRMALLMVNEAARCIAEKVVAEPADVDFAMIMGAGFAPFRGGPLRYADSLGAPAIAEALREEAARSGAHFGPCDLIQEMSNTNRSFYDDP